MAARLKVFVTSDGLTDYVVATTSKAKALAAWGVSQDAFQRGHAWQTDDPALVKAATATPDVVLRRPVAGARGKVARLKPAAPKAVKLKPAKLKPAKPPKPAKPKGPTKAQLKRVADLEGQLAALGKRVEAERAKLARDAAALAKRQAGVEAKARTERSRLQARLKAARQALG